MSTKINYFSAKYIVMAIILAVACAVPVPFLVGGNNSSTSAYVAGETINFTIQVIKDGGTPSYYQCSISNSADAEATIAGSTSTLLLNLEQGHTYKIDILGPTFLCVECMYNQNEWLSTTAKSFYIYVNDDDCSLEIYAYVPAGADEGFTPIIDNSWLTKYV